MNSKKTWFHVMTSLAIMLACSAIAAAQSSPLVYVSALGSDSNTGGRSSPVRTITHALSLVQSGGDVVVIDSGDYDEFRAGKSVTVETAPGVIAVIPDLNNSTAIDASPPSNGTVVLRGLTITTCGTSATTGIFSAGFTPQGTLVVENCVVNGAFNIGIYADQTKLFVKDTTVTGCNYGMMAVSSSGSTSSACIATIERCRVVGNTYGLTAYYNSKVTVRESVASGNSGRGMQAQGWSGQPTAELNVERCLASGNGYGFAADLNGGTTLLRLSDSFATDNQTGIYAPDHFSFYTRGNNTASGNSSCDACVGTFNPLKAY